MHNPHGTLVFSQHTTSPLPSHHHHPVQNNTDHGQQRGRGWEGARAHQHQHEQHFLLPVLDGCPSPHPHADLPASRASRDAPLTTPRRPLPGRHHRNPPGPSHLVRHWLPFLLLVLVLDQGKRCRPDHRDSTGDGMLRPHLGRGPKGYARQGGRRTTQAQRMGCLGSFNGIDGTHGALAGVIAASTTSSSSTSGVSACRVVVVVGASLFFFFFFFFFSFFCGDWRGRRRRRCGGK